MSMLLKALVITTLCIISVYSQSNAEPSQTEMDHLYSNESNTGIKQVYNLMDQLTSKVGDIPPYIERIAIYQLKVRRGEFNPGMVRFIRGHIEEIMMRNARRKMVTAPELRRVRIQSTDSTFLMSSSIPTTDELWNLGERLRVDGFLEGSITRTDEGDVLLSLKIFKHKTNEQVWSVNLVAGPNHTEDNSLYYEYNIKSTFVYWPIEKFIQDGVVASDQLTLYGYTIDYVIGEATTVNRLLNLSFFAGFGMYIPMSGKENDDVFNKLSRKFPVSVGFDLTGIMLPKLNPDEGYWLGVGTGVRSLIFDNIWAVNVSLKSRLTPHFGIGAGANIYPLNRTFEPSLIDVTDNYELKMEMVSYEGFLHYYF